VPYFLHINDLPDDVSFDGDLAVDTETRGLNIVNRDRLCVVQISDGKGDAHLVHFPDGDFDKANRLKSLLADEGRVKIFHYARFDVAALKLYLNIDIKNIYCTKIASKLVRTYTDRHSLKELCREYANVDLSKQQQCSDWSAPELTPDQVAYAASDVLYLHAIRTKLDEVLLRENRVDLFRKCLDFLPERVALDIGGWSEIDIFSH